MSQRPFQTGPDIDSIPWREPLPVTVTDYLEGVGFTPVRGLACRLCIARYGLRGQDVGKLPQTREEFDAHMAQMHEGEDRP